LDFSNANKRPTKIVDDGIACGFLINVDRPFAGVIALELDSRLEHELGRRSEGDAGWVENTARVRRE
jgi:hypothetical protein